MTVHHDRFSGLKKIGELSDNGVCILNVEANTISYVNEGMARILGVSSETLRRDPASVIEKINPDDLPFVKRQFEFLLQTSAIYDVEFCIRSESRLRFLLVDAYRLDAEIVFYVKDISRKRENEQYIIDYGGKKDTMLEMLSHNLSSPLMLTKRVLHSLEKAFEARRYSDIAAHVKFVEEATSYCIDIIHDFLKEEHFVSERILVKQTRFNVVEKIQLLVDKFKQSYVGNDLRFTSRVDSLFVTSDEVKLLQIINNLISNSLKFTPANCAVEVILAAGETSFTIIVKDDGIGIPQHLQPLVFQKYTPAGRAGLQGEKSLGVGLSIVKKLVELLKGTIRFESKENQGTTFYLTFPREIVSRESQHWL